MSSKQFQNSARFLFRDEFGNIYYIYLEEMSTWVFIQN